MMMNQQVIQPKYLSWKCIDNFKNLDSSEMFYIGAAQHSKRKGVILNELFIEMREKWSTLIMNEFSQDSQHFKVTGGNYTFFFALPHLFNYFREAHPFAKLKIELLEARNASDLTLKNADIVLSSRYIGEPNWSDNYKNILETNYVFSRKNYNDFVYLATSSDSIKKYGSKENVLKKHALIFTHTYVTMNFDSEKKIYSNAPKFRENEEKKVTVGLYRIGYEMMLNSIGLCHVFKNDAYKKEIAVLDENPISRMQRFVFYKNDCNAIYRKTFHKFLHQTFNQDGKNQDGKNQDGKNQDGKIKI